MFSPRRHAGRSSEYHDETAPLHEVLARLGIPLRKPAVIVVGGADSRVSPEESQARRRLIGLAVVPACRDAGAVLITGGTDFGVMREVGRAAAEVAPDMPLLGVAPRRKIKGIRGYSDSDAVDPEPHHRMLLTTGSEWGDELEVMARVAELLAGRDVVVIAIGGGPGTVKELRLAQQRQWAILTLTGLGGASADLAREVLAERRAVVKLSRRRVFMPRWFWRGWGGQRLDASASRPKVLVSEIVAVDAVARNLRWVLTGPSILKEAWSRYQTTDKLSVRMKRPERFTVRVVLILTALTVIVAAAGKRLELTRGSVPWVLAQTALTTMPLMGGVLLAGLDRAGRVGTWLNMRKAAESLLREIYRYRCRVAPYDEDANRELLLSSTMTTIENQAGGQIAAFAEGEELAIWPGEALLARVGVADDLLGPLTSRQYDEVRVTGQTRYYQMAADSLNRRSLRQTFLVLVAGAIASGCFAASWLSSTPGLVSAGFLGILAVLLTWREYEQLESRRDSFRSTAVELRAARARWLATPTALGDTSTELADYASVVEEILGSEGSEWERALRQSQSATFDRLKGR